MLSHLRVLDLCDGSRALAGQILAQLGAEVILIEPPEGVASRHVGPFADQEEDPEKSLEFWAAHRGKRSIALDLSSAEGRSELAGLAGSADVWIEDGSLGDLGPAFSAARLAEAAPQLVTCSIRAYGARGPKADWPATDLTATAASVTMSLTGEADRAPLGTSVPQAFYHAAGDAASAIMIALEERKRSGLGQHLDVSAQASFMQANQSAVLAHGWGSTPLERTGGGVSFLGYPIRFIYECADGFMNLTFLFGEPIGHATARFFAWMEEEGFANEATRGRDWVGYAAAIMNDAVSLETHMEILDTIERFTRTKTKADILQAAFERSLLIVPLNDARDLVESKQLADREFWVPIKHPGMDREVVHPGAFAHMSATPLVADRPAPRLGELHVEAGRSRAKAKRAQQVANGGCPSPASRCSTSAGSTPARPSHDSSPRTAPPSSRSSHQRPPTRFAAISP